MYSSTGAGYTYDISLPMITGGAVLIHFDYVGTILVLVDFNGGSNVFGNSSAQAFVSVSKKSATSIRITFAATTVPSYYKIIG